MNHILQVYLPYNNKEIPDNTTQSTGPNSMPHHLNKIAWEISFNKIDFLALELKL